MTLLTLGLAGCDGLLGCTDAGCADGITVRLDGVSGGEVVALTMFVEGKEPISLSCDPGGDMCYYAGVTEVGTPDEIVLALELADTTITRSFEPQYRTVRPNGSGCDPTCREALVTFHVD